jgi:hypothetical protein
MASTGLLGVNPYYKGTQIDVSKPVNLAIQLEQKEQAKKEALDKYFMDYEKSLNPAGMRTQDQDVFLKKLAENKEYYLQNRNKILNPSKYGAEAQSEYMSRFKNILSDIDKSKQLAANGKVIATAMMDAKKNNKTIPKEITDSIYNNQLSIGDSNHVDFDPTNFDAYDKHDENKFKQAVYSNIKPSESIPQRIEDKANHEVLYKTINQIDKKALPEIETAVGSELLKNRGFVDVINQISLDQNQLNKLADSYYNFSGKKMNPNSIRDVATAYAISLRPSDIEKFTTPTENKEYARLQSLYNSKNLASYRKGLGLDGSSDIDPVTTYLDQSGSGATFAGDVGSGVERLNLPQKVADEFKKNKTDRTPIIGKGLNDNKFYSIQFQKEIDENGKPTGKTTDLIDWTKTTEIPEIQMRSSVVNHALPSNAKIAITQGRAKGNKSNTPPPFKMK